MYLCSALLRSKHDSEYKSTTKDHTNNKLFHLPVNHAHSEVSSNEFKSWLLLQPCDLGQIINLSEVLVLRL